MADGVSTGGGRGGLVIASTGTIQSFLRSAAEDPFNLPPELHALASEFSSQSSIPYRSLRSIWSKSPASTRQPLSSLFSGAGFVFSSPKPREKSEELKERLRKLEELAERKSYRELVKDVVPKEEILEPFSSYKDQISFGVHVVLIMFTGYLVGFYTFRALFNHSVVMNAAGGIFGLVCGMLLETVLFIIRTSNMDSTSSRSTSKIKKDN